MSTENIIKTLSELVSIQSISSDINHKEDVLMSAEYVNELFSSLGLETKIATSGNSRPAVLAQTDTDPTKKTVLLYAHHDVQPVGDIDKWKNEPFTPKVIDGRLFGRGSGDNKAGVVVHYEVAKALIDDLPVNIKIFIEGEEEIGSPCMAEFLNEFQDDLEADVIVIADSGNIKIGTPTVTTSLRGLVDGMIVVEQPMRAVHSGLGGGVVPDAFMVLSKIIASFHNEKGELQIEGLTPSDMEVLELEENDIKEIFGSEDINLFELESISKRLWLEPALSILAIDAPSTQEAVNLLIPNAKAKVSLRLPPTENPEHAMKMLEAHIMKNIPWGAKVSFIPEAMGSGIVADPNKVFTKILVKNFEEVWDNNAAYMGVGGSIPFANDFVEKFPNAELVLVGAGDEEMGNAHAPNESVQIEDIENLIKSLIKTLKDFS